MCHWYHQTATSCKPSTRTTSMSHPGFTNQTTGKQWVNQLQNVHKWFLHSTESIQLEPRSTVFANITKQQRRTHGSISSFSQKMKTSENQNTTAQWCVLCWKARESKVVVSMRLLLAQGGESRVQPPRLQSAHLVVNSCILHLILFNFLYT